MKKKRKGFTLIELLVTLAIIAIIATITFVVINSVNSTSEAVVTEVNEESLSKAAITYVQEFMMNTNEWDLDIEGNEYVCISVNQLKNKGYLKGKLVDENGNSINDKTIKVVRDENKVISNNVVVGSEDCNADPQIEIEVEGSYKEISGNKWYYIKEDAKVVFTFNYEINYFSESIIKVGNQSIKDKLILVESSKNSYKYELNLGDINNLGKDTVIYAKLVFKNKKAEANKTINVDFTTPEKPTLTASDNITTGKIHSSDFDLKVSGGGTSPSGIYYKYKLNGSSEQNVVSFKIRITKNTINTIEVRTCNNIGKCSGYSTYTTIKPALVVSGKITGKLLFTEDYDKMYFSNVKIDTSYNNYTKLSYYVGSKGADNPPIYTEFKSNNEIATNYDISKITDSSAGSISGYYHAWIMAEDSEGNAIIEYIGYSRVSTSTRSCDKDLEECRRRITRSRNGDMDFINWYWDEYRENRHTTAGGWQSRVFDLYDGDELYGTYPYHEYTNTGSSYYIDFYGARTHPYYTGFSPTIKNKTWSLIESGNTSCESGYSCPYGGKLKNRKCVEPDSLDFCKADNCTYKVVNTFGTNYDIVTTYTDVTCTCAYAGATPGVLDSTITPAGSCPDGYTMTVTGSSTGNTCPPCTSSGNYPGYELEGYARCSWNGDYDAEIVEGGCKPSYTEVYGCPATPNGKEKVLETTTQCYYCIEMSFSYFDRETQTCNYPEYLKKYAYIFSYFDQDNL